jgi:hypothetical protein
MQKLSYIKNNKLTATWPEDELFKVTKLLNKKHMIYLENEHFEIESSFDQNQVQLCISLTKKDMSKSYPIECVFIKETNQSYQNSSIALTMLDYLDIYWTNYFSEERTVFVPLDWSKHEFEGLNFYIRGFIRNLDLETNANEFLSKHGYGGYDILPISSET